MKRALVFVLTLCLLTFAACGQSDMVVQAGTTKPDPNNKNLDWGVMMEVADLTPTGCTLKDKKVSTLLLIRYIINMLSTLSSRKEVTLLELYTSFLLSIVASVIAYYICKWLDG